ncbi:MAG: transpeptidase family protein [Tannerellaceae bacterium]|jgi:cell division protein FtsI (penicillin-binding protein 3)|nr:transpeptidase family protein [Tannerellaceae bacterium]
MSHTKQSENKWAEVRYGIVVLLLIALGGLIVVAILRIAYVEKKAWQTIADMEKAKLPKNVIYPERGNIYSSDGRLMATSFPLYSLYIDFRSEKDIDSTSFLQIPKAKKGAVPNEEQIAASLRNGVDSLAYCLARKFGRDERKLRSELMAAFRRRDASFPLTDSPISYFDMKEVISFPYLRLGQFRSGRIVVETVKRDYPYHSLAQRTIGNIYAERDTAGYSRGRVGLEFHYDSLLRGETGLQKKQRVGRGWIDGIIREAVRGMDIRTTIDLDVQFIAEKALRRMMTITEAEAGSVVVMDVKTGEVRAISNMGIVSPGVYAETGNYAIRDMIEPGSIFKIASIIVALEDTVCRPDDLVDTGKGLFTYQGEVISDYNHASGGNGIITVEEGIIRSSNICISKVAIKGYARNPAKYVEGLYHLGLTEDLHLEIPGAGRPIIRMPNRNNWYPVALPFMSFGYETKIPPIYMLTLYNAIANNGKMMRPFFVKDILQEGKVVHSNKPEVIREAICSPQTLRSVKKMLIGVVENEHGTGRNAYSPLIRIAGKTGSAQIVKNRRYQTNVLNVSFAGYFPADDPEYSVITVIRQPKRRNAGGDAGAGVVKEIAEGIYVSRNFTDLRKMQAESQAVRIPAIKAGNAEATIDVLKELKIRTERNNLESPWTSISRTDNSIKLADMRIDNGLMPNLAGMGAKDAIYLLESIGLRVKISGRGYVATQSVQAGQRITKGQTISITLK